MTFINEHKILGSDDTNTAVVGDDEALRITSPMLLDKLSQLITIMTKVEYHLSIITDTDLTNGNL